MAKRYEISRNLIRIRVESDEDAATADMVQEYTEPPFRAQVESKVDRHSPCTVRAWSPLHEFRACTNSAPAPIFGRRHDTQTPEKRLSSPVVAALKHSGLEGSAPGEETMADPKGRAEAPVAKQESSRPSLGTESFQRDREYVRRLLITLAVIGLAYLLWRISGVLLLLFTAVLLAVLLRSFANVIARHTPVPERWGLTVGTITAIALVIGLMVLFGSQFLGQLTLVIEKLPAALDAAGDRIGFSNASAELERAINESSGGAVLSRAAGLGYTVLGALADLVLVLVAAIYLAADPQLYRQGAAKLLPPSQHERVFDAFDTTGNALRLWFLGQLATMAIVGVASGLAYWWIGLPSALALGTIAALTNFVPYFGPIVGAIPALLFASAMDLKSVLWTIGFVFAIQQLEGNIITPYVQSKAVSMPPVLVLFAIVVFGLVFGVLGVLVAVPLAVAVTVVVKKLWIRQTLGEQTVVPGEEHAKPQPS